MERITKADSLFRQGCESYTEDRTRAAALFAAALAEDPRHQGALVMSAQCEGNFEKQRELLQRAIDVDSTSEDGQRAEQLLKAIETGHQDQPEDSRSELPPTTPGTDSVGNTPSGEPSEPKNRLTDKYEIVEQLSAGGSGITYLVCDKKLKQLYVMKRFIPRNGAEQQLAREVAILVSLNRPGHESIPPIHEYLDQERCLVMKHVDGQTLYQLFEHSSMPESLALRYMRDACSALAYIHNHQEIEGEDVPKLHGDVSPANLMRDRRKRIWLVDYGLTNTLDKANGRGGTPKFVAPEREKGNGGRYSDVYSLGKTFEYLTHYSGKPAKLSPKFKQLLDRTTDPSPDKRPTAEWLVESLDQILALRFARRMIAGLIAVITIMLLTYLLLLFPEMRRPRQPPNNSAQLREVQNKLTETEGKLTKTEGKLTDANKKIKELEEAPPKANIPFPTKPIACCTAASLGSETGELKEDRMTEFFTFEANTGQSVTIEVKASSPNRSGVILGLEDPVLLLYGPDGHIIEYNDDYYDENRDYSLDAHIEATLSQSGTYLIQVTSYKYDFASDSPPLGTYQLSIASARR